jgi:thioredoxin reductase (NADPH)
MPTWDVVIVGGGIAGLSAAIYLGRAQRNVVVIDAGKSMARWEPNVENYLGFPQGVDGAELVRRGREQASASGAELIEDEILDVAGLRGRFEARGQKQTYTGDRMLLATGIYHIPPDIPGVADCLGHTMFFCKDCDGVRVVGKRVVVFGCCNDAVEYALAMLLYTPKVAIVTNGKAGSWDEQHARWIEEYAIPVIHAKIADVDREGCELRGLRFEDGVRLEADALFTTRGDIFQNAFAKALGAELDADGEIVVDACLQTTVPGLYAAGCVTPANCQMIIAAGQGATAAQAMNRALFEESLHNHRLRRIREEQVGPVPELIGK